MFLLAGTALASVKFKSSCTVCYAYIRICKIVNIPNVVVFTITLYFRKGGKVLLNSSASYLLRSKRVGQNEAGMLASGAALNSVALANQ